MVINCTMISEDVAGGAVELLCYRCVSNILSIIIDLNGLDKIL